MLTHTTLKCRLKLIITIVLLSVFTFADVTMANAAIIYKNVIHNLSPELQKNVVARFTAQQNVPAKSLTRDIANNWYYNGPQTIRLALQPFGYFNPKITHHLEQRGNNWLASYTVNAGPQTHIAKIDLQISGPHKNDKKILELRHKLPIKIGDVYNSKVYDQAKDQVFLNMTQWGYLNARMNKSQVQVDRKHNSASIIFILETGPRSYFGKITFNQTPFADEFLRRFLNIRKNQVYRPHDLIILQQNLANSGYFQHVNVKPQPRKAVNHRIPIKINLQAYKSQQYLLGFGYGTDTNFRGTAGLNFRRITATGQHFSAIVQASRVQNALEARYIIPGSNPLVNQFSIGAAIENMTPQSSRSQTTRFNLSYLTKHKVWQQTIGLTYQHDRFRINNGPTHSVNTLYPTISWMRLFTDNPIHTTNGFRINAHVLGGGKEVGSDIYFTQIQTSGKLIKTFYPGGRLLLRGIIGHTAVSNRDLLPLSLQYFAGGAQNVRGYGFQSLGPGRSTIVGSVEFQQRIVGNWYVSAFYDIGKAFNENFIKAAGELKRSAGFGVVLITAVGPIEISLARPLHDPDNHKFRLQFSMGPDL